MLFSQSSKNDELNDAPVSHTFAEQNKNHELFSRQISTAILCARRKTKLLRKEKHAAKQAAVRIHTIWSLLHPQKSEKLVGVSEKEQMLIKVKTEIHNL